MKFRDPDNNKLRVTNLSRLIAKVWIVGFDTAPTKLERLELRGRGRLVFIGLNQCISIMIQPPYFITQVLIGKYSPD